MWFSFGTWGATSIGFILAIAFWKKEVFTGLDNLSHWLATGGFKGYAIIFFLIFVTTIRKWRLSYRNEVEPTELTHFTQPRFPCFRHS